MLVQSVQRGVAKGSYTSLLRIHEHTSDDNWESPHGLPGTALLVRALLRWYYHVSMQNSSVGNLYSQLS